MFDAVLCSLAVFDLRVGHIMDVLLHLSRSSLTVHVLMFSIQVFLARVHLALFLALSLFLFPYGVTIVC